MPSGFFALLDDLALIMDDVAAMTKVAGKKTAGILGRGYSLASGGHCVGAGGLSLAQHEVGRGE